MILILSLYYIIINSAEGQLMRKTKCCGRVHDNVSPSDSIGQSPSVDRILTPGRKTPLQHETLQPCGSTFWICLQVIERTTIIMLTLYAIWLRGSKFYVFFAKKPIFPHNKGLACNYYKMLVVNVMVPPTSVSYQKLLITHQLTNYVRCWDFWNTPIPEAHLSVIGDTANRLGFHSTEWRPNRLAVSLVTDNLSLWNLEYFGTLNTELNKLIEVFFW